MDVEEMRLTEFLDHEFLGRSQYQCSTIEKMNITKARHCVWFNCYELAVAYIDFWAGHRAKEAHAFAARNALDTVADVRNARVWYPVSLAGRNQPTLRPHASKVLRHVLQHFNLSPGTPG